MRGHGSPLAEGRRNEKGEEGEQRESRKREALIASPSLPSVPTHLRLAIHLHSAPPVGGLLSRIYVTPNGAT